MGFIFGLMIGSMASGGSTAMPPALGSIPFRCLYASEISASEYGDCRAASLHAELWAGGICDWDQRRRADGNCSVSRHITWEIAALRELKKAMEAKRAADR